MATKTPTAGTKKPATTKALVTYQLDEEMGQMMALAVELAKSRIVPMAYINAPANVFTAIQFGKELGMKPITSLQNIAVINGRASLGTDMALALAMRHPEWAGYEIVTLTDQACEVKVYRNLKSIGKIVSYDGSFTMTEAKNAGLIKAGGNWEKWKKRMLKHRATMFALRDAFPDALTGIHSDEELEPEKFAAEEEMRNVGLDEVEAAILEERDMPVEVYGSAPRATSAPKPKVTKAPTVTNKVKSATTIKKK